MFPGPFLKREMVTSVRCARVIRDRLIALLLVAWGVAGCVVVWDEWGWDRTSVREAAWFALVAFGLTAFAQAGMRSGLSSARSPRRSLRSATGRAWTRC